MVIVMRLKTQRGVLETKGALSHASGAAREVLRGAAGQGCGRCALGRVAGAVPGQDRFALRWGTASVQWPCPGNNASS